MSDTREMVSVVVGKRPNARSLVFYFGTPSEAVEFADRLRAVKNVNVVHAMPVRNDLVDTAVNVVRDAAARYNGVHG